MTARQNGSSTMGLCEQDSRSHDVGVCEILVMKTSTVDEVAGLEAQELRLCNER